MFVVVNNNHFCSLLEVTDRNRATTSVTSLLQELEIKRVVSSADVNVVNEFILLSTSTTLRSKERKGKRKNRWIGKCRINDE